MTLLDYIGPAIQSVALLTIVVVCVCRLNATQPGTRWALRMAYTLLAVGAFAQVVEAQYTLSSMVIASGVALVMVADRRRSLCYDKPVAQVVS